ncbi:hypothetical protein BC332_20440 [Capsicum chinense]|nr:hypothetical protein BC332_20440 [Capsicum chinense]
MKIAPMKPHFFKPILPNFKHGIKIPIAFSKHLKGINQERAILRRAGKKWCVKVNGRLLGEGWAKFVEEHDLQLGDVLIFRHEGAMEFEVSVFDSNQFERKYEHTAEGVNEAGEEINHTCKKFTSQAKTTKKPKLDSKSPHEVFPKVEAEDNMPLGRPHFIYTITPYFLSRDNFFGKYLDLPEDKNARLQMKMAYELLKYRFMYENKDKMDEVWINYCGMPGGLVIVDGLSGDGAVSGGSSAAVVLMMLLLQYLKQTIMSMIILVIQISPLSANVLQVNVKTIGQNMM